MKPKPIIWSAQQSQCGRFDFLIGRVNYSVIFTANPKTIPDTGDWYLRCYLGPESERTVKLTELKEIAEDILAQVIHDLTI